MYSVLFEPPLLFCSFSSENCICLCKHARTFCRWSRLLPINIPTCRLVFAFYLNLFYLSDILIFTDCVYKTAFNATCVETPSPSRKIDHGINHESYFHSLSASQHPTTSPFYNNNTTLYYIPKNPIATMRAACLPSTKVTVTINGHALQELQHTENNNGRGKGASAFIESVDSAAFAVELDLEEGLKNYFGSVEFTVHLDGKFMGGSVVDMADGEQNTSVSGIHENYRGGARFRRFEFTRDEMGTLRCR